MQKTGSSQGPPNPIYHFHVGFIGVHGRNESTGSLNTHGEALKHLPNSSILNINHELDSIDVNKGQIHGELIYVLFEI